MTIRPARTAFLYVIAGADGSGPYKVGVTYNLHRRLRELQTGESRPLGLAHTLKLDRAHAERAERRAHALLAESHLHGEWFDAALTDVTAAADRAVAETAQTATSDPAAPAPATRRTVWTPQRRAEVWPNLLQHIAEGGSLEAWCKPDGRPSYNTVYEWIRQDEALSQEYARARELQGDSYADRVAEIAARVERGDLDPHAGRTAIDALKWLAAKRKPKVYGDRLDVGLQPGALGPVGWVINLSPPVGPVIDGTCEQTPILGPQSQPGEEAES